MPLCGVCPSVCPSVTFVNSVETSNHILRLFSQFGSQTILVLHTEPYGDIQTGTPLTRASDPGGVGRNRDSEPIFGFIACCQRCDRLDVINTVPLDRGKL